MLYASLRSVVRNWEPACGTERSVASAKKPGTRPKGGNPQDKCKILLGFHPAGKEFCTRLPCMLDYHLIRLSKNMHMDRSNAVLTRVEEGISMKSDIDNKEVGKRLQNFREVRGLTRAVLALRMDMSEKDLEDIEAGKKQLSPENIEVLRETFSIDPAWLLGGQTL